MRDEALLKVVAEIPKQAQRQYATDDQLRVLREAAVRLGLYDAADFVENWLNKK